MISQHPAEWYNSEFTKFLSNFSYIVMEHFKAATHDSETPIFATDLHGSILFSNSAAKKMFMNGYGNIIGLPVSKVIHFAQCPQRTNSKNRWSKLIHEGLLIGAELEKVVRLSNGMQMEVMLSGSPMFDMAGQIKGGAFLVKAASQLESRQ